MVPYVGNVPFETKYFVELRSDTRRTACARRLGDVSNTLGDSQFAMVREIWSSDRNLSFFAYAARRNFHT